MDATHPLFRGPDRATCSAGQRAARCAGADAVLIVGTYVFPEVFPLLDRPFAPGARVVHIDLDAYEIAKNFPVDLGAGRRPEADAGGAGRAARPARPGRRRRWAARRRGR